MILSDADLYKRLAADLRIEPMSADAVQPASIDVCIDSELYHVSSDTYTHTDRICLQPGEFYLGSTQEHITLPNDIAAQLAGRSTLGRQGVVVHKTAGWIDPGFSGHITLELYNFSDDVVTIETGSRIGQLVCMQLLSASSGYDGQYQHQDGVTHAGEL